MLKICAHLSKKVPLEGVEFSSQQFSAGVETEVACNADEQTIRETLRRLYATLGQAIDEQIARAGVESAAPKPVPQSPAQVARNAFRGQARKFSPVQNRNGNGNGNGRSVSATPAQQKCIKAIVSDLGIDLADALSGYGVSQPSDLTVKAASELIDALKAQQRT